MKRLSAVKEEPTDPSVGAGVGAWTGEGVGAVGVGAGVVGGPVVRHSSKGTMLMGLLSPGSVNDTRGETEHNMLATP